MSPSTRPTLETAQLILRPFTLADAPRVQALAGERAIAAATLHIPHPYEDGMAEAWIETHQEKFEKHEEIIFAVTLRIDSSVIGAISLVLDRADENAELGYWVGKPFWNRGCATEAATAVIHYAFTTLRLHRVYARLWKRNAASARVLQKIGMKHEGCQREHVKKWNAFEDVELYGMLRDDFAAWRSR